MILASFTSAEEWLIPSTSLGISDSFEVPLPMSSILLIVLAAGLYLVYDEDYLARFADLPSIEAIFACRWRARCATNAGSSNEGSRGLENLECFLLLIHMLLLA